MNTVQFSMDMEEKEFGKAPVKTREREKSEKTFIVTRYQAKKKKKRKEDNSRQRSFISFPDFVNHQIFESIPSNHREGSTNDSLHSCESEDRPMSIVDSLLPPLRSFHHLDQCVEQCDIR